MVSRKIFHPLAIPVSTSEHLISLAPRVDESRGKEAEKQSYCIAVVRARVVLVRHLRWRDRLMLNA
jgi:hypothetical protein